MSGGTFLDMLVQKLQNRGRAGDWDVDRLAQAVVGLMDNSYPTIPPAPEMIVVPEQLARVSDTTMIHDMLRRGYAVMKLPEDGGAPEVLRG